MPEITVEFVLFALCVGLFTAAATVWDIRSRRIPNALTVPVLLAGLIYQISFHGWSGLGNAGQAFLLGFGTLFVVWLIGGGGGGDVKLMGALSVWLGLKLTALVLIGSTVFVILGTVLLMLWTLVTRWAGSRKSETEAAETSSPAGDAANGAARPRHVMAFAVPVTIATWVVVLLKLDEFPFVQ